LLNGSNKVHVNPRNRRSGGSVGFSFQGRLGGGSVAIFLALFVALLTLAACDKNGGGAVPADDPPPREMLPRSVIGESPGSVDPAQVRRAVNTLKKEGRPILEVFRLHDPLNEIIEMLELPPKAVVADIGGGTGILPVAMVDRGVDFQRLYLVEIDKQALDIAEIVFKAAGITREQVVPVLSQFDDVKLPPGSVDVAVVLSVSAFQAEKDRDGNWKANDVAVACLRTLGTSLKAGGRVDFIYDESLKNDLESRHEAALATFTAAGFTPVRDRYLSLGNRRYMHLRFVTATD
jgi:hypothetical protein